MARIIDGSSVLAYKGVKPITPPNMVVPGNPPFSAPRNPNQTDINYNLGDFWLNTATEQAWILVQLGSHLVAGVNTRFATWVMFTGGQGTVQFLQGNTGGPVGPDGAGVIHTIGDPASGIVVNGNPGTNTLTWTSSGGGHFGETETGDVGGPVPFDAAGNLNVVGAAGSGVVVTGTPGTNTLAIGASGGGHFGESLTGDTGGAVPFDAAGNIDVIANHAANNAGSSVLIAGNAGANTLTLNVTDASDNTLIGNLAGNLTLTGTNNTGLGSGSVLNDLTTGSNNTGIGFNSLDNITTGSGNTCIGSGSGGALTAGNSNNLCLNYAGIAGSSANWYFSLGNGTLFAHNFGTNTFYGENAGNVVAPDNSNVGIGSAALHSLSTGGNGANDNVAIGVNAMTNYTFSTTAPYTGGNTAVGSVAMQALTTGGVNTAIGNASLLNLTTGNANTALGAGSGSALTTASYNILIGEAAGVNPGGGSGLITGSQNVIITTIQYPTNYTAAESSNVLVQSAGVNAENNTIRIGTSGAGAGQQNRCFVAGIRGITTGVNDAIAVLIDSAGQLGTVSSSIRYKENVEDLGSYSNDLYDLRPVRFNYKQHPSSAKSVGLIAEEVIKVYPDLVVKDSHGCPETVKYQDLPVLLLNELQRHQQVIEHLLQRIEALEGNV